MAWGDQTESVPKEEDVNARGTAGRLPVGLASLALVAGCASGASPTPVPATPTPIVTPSAAVATPPPAPMPTASAAGPMTYGPVTVVTGAETCPGLNPDWTRDPNGTWQVRDLTVECTDTTDDPRVSGTHTATWSMDVWGALDEGAGAGVQWGTVRLENAGGAWEGQLSGVASLPGRGDIITIWYRGTGGYDGLAYFELVTGSPPTGRSRGRSSPAILHLRTRRAGRPSLGRRPAGRSPTTQWPWSRAPRRAPAWTSTLTTDPDGTWHVRDDYHADRCTLTTDDPRVTGLRSSTWNFDLWGNPSSGRWALVQWGTQRLENDGGAWEGRATGVGSSRRGDIIVNWYKGTGGYDGLAYFELWTGSGPWKIQGQIFPGDPPMP